MDSVEKRARHRDKTDVFAEESEALDQIAKQVSTPQLKLEIVRRNCKCRFDITKRSLYRTVAGLELRN